MSESRAGSPAADGSPPLPDGQVVPQPPRPASPPVTRRQYVYGLLCVALVVVAVAIGVLR